METIFHLNIHWLPGWFDRSIPRVVMAACITSAPWVIACYGLWHWHTAAFGLDATLVLRALACGCGAMAFLIFLATFVALAESNSLYNILGRPKDWDPR